jgi:hypothetical protein
MLSQIAYSETVVPTSSTELRAVIKRRLVSILSTADFQDVQYLKDCQFEFEVRCISPVRACVRICSLRER